MCHPVPRSIARPSDRPGPRASFRSALRVACASLNRPARLRPDDWQGDISPSLLSSVFPPTGERVSCSSCQSVSGVLRLFPCGRAACTHIITLTPSGQILPCRRSFAVRSCLDAVCACVVRFPAGICRERVGCAVSSVLVYQ